MSFMKNITSAKSLKDKKMQCQNCTFYFEGMCNVHARIISCWTCFNHIILYWVNFDNNKFSFQWSTLKMKTKYFLLFVFIFSDICEGKFTDTERRWLFDPVDSCDADDVECGQGCEYHLETLRRDGFGARVTGLHLGSLSQTCADKLMQEAMMYRWDTSQHFETWCWHRQNQILFR